MAHLATWSEWWDRLIAPHLVSPGRAAHQQERGPAPGPALPGPGVRAFAGGSSIPD